MTTAYSYALANDTRLSQLAHNLSGSANDLTLNFTWTPASQINTREAVQNAYSWTAHYAEDLTATLNGLNQVTAFGAAITYDNRGNLTADGTRTFGYDAQNRLISAPAAGMTQTLRYDPLGRLYETAVPGLSSTRFLYDGAEAIAEYDSDGGLQQRYVRGAGADEVLVWYQRQPNGTFAYRFLLTDERGSVIAGANALGQAVFKNKYDEYGRPASTNTGRFQYTGQMYLTEAGLYHYKARVYDPGLGRFLQTDPIGYADGLNLYAYVANDPINNADPSGLFCYASRISSCAQQNNASGGGGSSSAGGGGDGGSGLPSPHAGPSNHIGPGNPFGFATNPFSGGSGSGGGGSSGGGIGSGRSSPHAAPTNVIQDALNLGFVSTSLSDFLLVSDKQTPADEAKRAAKAKDKACDIINKTVAIASIISVLGNAVGSIPTPQTLVVGRSVGAAAGVIAFGFGIASLGGGCV